MRMEMEGKEPLIVLFGVPVLTAGIVLASMYFGRLQVPQAIQVSAPVSLSPNLNADLRVPANGFRVEVPPAQIHEVVKEVVRVPDVSVVNQVPQAPAPYVEVRVPESRASAPLPSEKTGEADAPTANAKPVIETRAPHESDAAPETQPTSVTGEQLVTREGALLPPPNDRPKEAAKSGR